MKKIDFNLLPVRIENRLRQEEIIYEEQLELMTEEKFLQLRNIGKNSVFIIKDYMRKNQLNFLDSYSSAEGMYTFLRSKYSSILFDLCVAVDDLKKINNAIEDSMKLFNVAMKEGFSSAKEIEKLMKRKNA